MKHNRRKQIRRNLLEMYRDNAMRSQSYMDVLRLEKFLAVMQAKFQNELDGYDRKRVTLVTVDGQLNLFHIGSGN